MAEPRAPAPSQDAGRFHGREPSLWAEEEESSVAQPVMAAVRRMSRLILSSLVNDVIAGLDAESASEARWDDVCNGCG